MNKPKYIACVASASGGHIIPTLTLAQDYIKTHPDSKILLFSTLKELDKKIIDQYDCISNYQFLNFYKKSGLINYLKFGASFFATFFKSLKTLKNTQPAQIICTGGYICIPVCAAAWILRIPISVFELNATVGKTNRLLSFFASNVYVIFQDTSKYFKKTECKFVDYPIRFNSKNIIEQKEALEKINFDADKKTILILGGSQGSSFINQLIKKIFAEKSFQDLQIIHQAGKGEYLELQEFYKEQNIKSIVFDYFHDLSIYYCAADLVICRAGAGTLFETKFFNKKAIVIPLETKTNDHQLFNALAMQKAHPEIFTCVRQNEAFEKLKIFFYKLCSPKAYK